MPNYDLLLTAIYAQWLTVMGNDEVYAEPAAWHDAYYCFSDYSDKQQKAILQVMVVITPFLKDIFARLWTDTVPLLMNRIMHALSEVEDEDFPMSVWGIFARMETELQKKLDLAIIPRAYPSLSSRRESLSGGRHPMQTGYGRLVMDSLDLRITRSFTGLYCRNRDFLALVRGVFNLMELNNNREHEMDYGVPLD